LEECSTHLLLALFVNDGLLLSVVNDGLLLENSAIL
jgi:hypothetical protein